MGVKEVFNTAIEVAVRASQSKKNNFVINLGPIYAPLMREACEKQHIAKVAQMLDVCDLVSINEKKALEKKSVI